MWRARFEFYPLECCKFEQNITQNYYESLCKLFQLVPDEVSLCIIWIELREEFAKFILNHF